METKIIEEDLKKLSQLDRIEFRQKRQWLYEQKVDVGAISFFNQLCVILGFLFLFYLGLYIINSDSASNILFIIPPIIKVGFLLAGILIGSQLFFDRKFFKEKRKLLEEYFKVEINKKK